MPTKKTAAVKKAATPEVEKPKRILDIAARVRVLQKTHASILKALSRGRRAKGQAEPISRFNTMRTELLARGVKGREAWNEFAAEVGMAPESKAESLFDDYPPVGPGRPRSTEPKVSASKKAKKAVEKASELVAEEAPVPAKKAAKKAAPPAKKTAAPAKKAVKKAAKKAAAEPVAEAG